MYFNNTVEHLDAITPSLIHNLLLYKSQYNFSNDARQLLGMYSKTQKYKNSNDDIKQAINDIVNYIQEQQYSIINNCRLVEASIVITQNRHHVLRLPSRKLCHIGEQLVIPIMGKITVTSKSNGRPYTKPVILDTGQCYRLNNRLPLTFVSDPEFMALVIIFLDKSHQYDHSVNIPHNQENSEFL